MSNDLIAVIATIAFAGVMVGCTLAGSGSLGLQQRAGLLERRNPGLAEALRRAEGMSDLARGGFTTGAEAFSAVCTPSRRSWMDGARVRAADSDLRVEPPEEALPPMPATVVALAGSRHVAEAPRPRHPSPRPSTGAPVGQSPAGANRSGHHASASG
ncbi:hypothetical protein [Agromyces arachidis]|uniref:hypothetical protein n=1 Tax=Agromyces arachidis TaxID=766966 RepID=UPI004056AC57